MSLTTQTDSTEADKSQLTPIEARIKAIAELIPTPKQKPFYLWALDVTPLPRPYAKTLEEFQIVEIYLRNGRNLQANSVFICL